MSKLFVIRALQAHLKARNLTYKDLALGLHLSEISVKRLFANADCKLERLEQICAYLHIELADLFRSSPKKEKWLSQLSYEQETEFARNKPLLMVAICALTHWPVNEMWEHLHITKSQGLRLLRRLDHMGFLALGAADQYKLLVSSSFTWIPGGPIMRMVQDMSQDFFNNAFDGPGEVLRIINIRISREAQTRLRQRMERLVQDCEDQSRADSHLPLSERPPLSICIAARAWIPKMIRDVVKMPDKSDR